MLEELLQHLTSQEITTLEDLATQMAISVPLLDQMLHDLERGGYVEVIALGCDQGCGGCAHDGVCALVQGKRIWRVTEKGFRLAGSHSG